MSTPFDIPVLLIVFSRFDTALQVVEALRQVKPKRVYVAADGARPHKAGEDKLCQETRDAVMGAIDWECEVFTRFSTENQGCGMGPANAVSWFFEQEEMGIILEDDCVPNESFFHFCNQLLHFYRYDSRIMHVSGYNIQHGQIRGSASYYFSRYAEVWGWASWRRAWKLFDFDMTVYPEFLTNKGLNFIFPEDGVNKKWMKNFKHVQNESPPTIWDYRWMYSIWKENGLCVTPNVPLVKNIGFDERAIHTKSPDNPFAKINACDIGEITHPKLVIPDFEADAYTTALRHHPPLLKRAKLKVRHLAKITLNL